MKLKKFFVYIVVAVLAMVTVSVYGCDKPVEEVSVKSIAMETMPTKTAFYMGDTFDPNGGTIKVTYDDGTTKIVALTDEGVELSKVNMNKVGDKTVTVNYEGKKCTFKIVVNEKQLSITLNLNYAGAQNKVVEATPGEKLAKPTAKRSGYTLYGWYVDSACMIPFDFTQKISDDLTLYAEWKENGATYYTISYDMGYYGVAPQTFEKIIKSGEKAVLPTVDMKRAEYRFDGWFVAPALTSEFTKNSVVSADVTVKAKWTKTKTGTSTYVFEAEDTDLTGKVGPGLSGTAQESGMIVRGDSASNGKAVSYLYRKGISLEFYIASGEAVTDATVTISIATDVENLFFNSQEYLVKVNDQALSYGDVTFGTEIKVYGDKIVIHNVSLKQGANLIQLVTNNNRNPLGEGGGTYEASAPMIDCVKITTSAVLTWDENYGLPKAY